MGSTVEKVHSLSVIVKVFVLDTKVVEGNNHCGVDVFLISRELKFITDRLLIDKIGTAIT